MACVVSVVVAKIERNDGRHNSNLDFLDFTQSASF